MSLVWDQFPGLQHPFTKLRTVAIKDVKDSAVLQRPRHSHLR